LINPNREVVSETAPLLALGVNNWGNIISQMVVVCSNGVPQSHVQISCFVDQDFVVVGGGAWADFTGQGAMLTGSFPTSQFQFLDSWTGRSKDHLVADPHTLRVFAIGIKLDGISRQTLTNHMFAFGTSVTGGRQQAVRASVGWPMEVIGGGAEVRFTGAGAMLTGSQPDCTGPPCRTWMAQSSDHITPDPHTLISYIISINPVIAGWGTMEFNYRMVEGPEMTGHHSITRSPILSWPVVSVGGFTDAEGGPGRFLTRMSHNLFVGDNQTVTVASKDHQQVSGGYTQLRTVQIRRKP
jgi:hypothetical protein